MLVIINYNDKYKDRKPKETIKIIQNFFKNKGLKVIESKSQQSEIGTWWVHLKLYYKNFLLLQSNGKGMTKQFSRASGYAELYERFCNAGNEMYATIAYQDIKKERYKRYNYYLCKEEKILTFQEATQSSPRIKYKFDLMNDYENNLEKVYNLAFENRLIGVPYIKLDNINEKKYLMPEIVQATTGSDGMAAGNTLEEALVQGISEVYEHIVWNKVYEDTHNLTPELDFKKLKLPKSLVNKGKKLYSLGYDFKIFDYSYLYNIPVIGVLLINKKEYNYSLILGASPIFEIALERCFTEIYQGILTQQEKRNIPIPIKNLSDRFHYQYFYFQNLNYRNCYNEQQFYKTIKYNTYNTQVFFKTININQLSNYNFLQYYIKLAQKLKLSFYYINNSQIKDFYAIHVFLDNYNIFPHMHYQFIKNKNENIKTECLIFLQEFFISYKEYLYKNNYNLLKELFFKYKNKFKDENFYNLVHDYLYYFPDIFSFYNKETSFLKIFFQILDGMNSNSQLNNIINNNSFFKEYYKNNNKLFKQQCLLLIFLIYEQYDKKEINLFFKNIFNINIKDIYYNFDKFQTFKDIFLIQLNLDKNYLKYIKKMVE